MDHDAYIEIAKRNLYGNYRQAPIVFKRGRGVQLEDVRGKRYLDLAAGVAVCSVGHAHPRLVKAISEQAAELMHVSNYFYNDRNIELADRICKTANLARALFCNSGSEANEALLKMARRHFYGRGEGHRKRIIAFHGAFHGRTLGSLSMTGTPPYREGFGVPGDVTHVHYGDIEAVGRELTDDVAAVIVEPILGEGGVLPAPEGFLKRIRELTRERGALMLVDEVQTGVGRLGKWFGSEGIDVDAMSLAKGLGGGFPIGVALAADTLIEALPPGTHGTTYGGNPLASRAALEVLSIIEDENLVAHASELGRFLGDSLDAIAKEFPDKLVAARGQGLLRGLILAEGQVARDWLPRFFEAGVLIIAAGASTLRFCPPLVIDKSELERGLSIVRDVIRRN